MNTGSIGAGLIGRRRNFPGALQSSVPPILALLFAGLLLAAPAPALAQSVSANLDDGVPAAEYRQEGNTLNYTTVITNSGGANATGVTLTNPTPAGTELVANSVHASPLAFTDAYTAVGNTKLYVGTTAPGGEPALVVAGSALLANDTISTSPDTIVLQTTGTIATSQGGSAAINSNGTFTYTPPVGFTGANSFGYSIRNSADASLADTGLVNITVSNRVWYVNNSYTGGNGASNGTSTRPFTNLDSLNGSVANVDGANDFIYVYLGSGVAYPGGLPLANSQILTSESNALVVGGNTLRAAVPGNIPTLSHTSGSTVALTTGSNTIDGFIITNSNGNGISGSQLGVTAIADIVVSVTNGTALNATSSGPPSTLTVTGSANTLNSTNGPALNVNAVTIGAAGLTFRSVAAGAGANNGISLVGTGSGGLTVTGLDGVDGGTDPDLGSGGTISGKTGADGSTTAGTGVFLSSANNVSLNGMIISNHQNYGIRGVQVDGFRLTFSQVGGTNGTNGASPFSEGSVSFIGTPTTGYGLRGNVAFLDNEITGGAQRNVSIDNATGTMNINFLRNNVHHSAPSFGDDGLAIEVDTSAVLFANVSSNTFTAHGGDHFNLSLVNSANADLTFTNNDMQGGHNVGLGQGVFILGATYNGTFKYDVSNNGTDADPFTGNKQGAAIFVNKGSGTGTFSGRIMNNVIGNPAVTASGSEQAQGIHASARGAGGSHTTLITGNKVRQYFDRGIVIEAGEGAPSLTATVTNNTVSNFADAINSLHGIHFDLGILAADNAQITIDVRNNLIAAAGNELQGGADFRMRTASSNDTFIAGYSGGNSSANAQAFIDAANPDGTTFSVSQAGTGTYNNGPASPLPTPILPTLPPAPSALKFADGGVGAGVSLASVDATFRGVEAPNSQALGGDALLSPNALTQSELDSVVAAAEQRWLAAGLSPSQVARLRSLRFEVAALGDLHLGEAAGDVIRVDSRAAGNNWFVDPHPRGDAEFASHLTGARRYTDPAGAPAGRIDLLTAVMHEMGHALGLEDTYHEQDRDALMYGFLTMGERRLPTQRDALAARAPGVAAHAHTRSHFLSSPLTIGTLPAGKSVTVKYLGDDRHDQLHDRQPGHGHRHRLRRALQCADQRPGNARRNSMRPSPMSRSRPTSPRIRSTRRRMWASPSPSTAAATSNPPATVQWEVSTDGGSCVQSGPARHQRHDHDRRRDARAERQHLSRRLHQQRHQPAPAQHGHEQQRDADRQSGAFHRPDDPSGRHRRRADQPDPHRVGRHAAVHHLRSDQLRRHRHGADPPG